MDQTDLKQANFAETVTDTDETAMAQTCKNDTLTAEALTTETPRTEMNKTDMLRRINELREERDAVIVSHYYQNDEVQEIADMVGDSFALAKYCAASEKSVIVFCGVHFMAESAHILSPEKTVLLPVLDAGCPMADMATAEGLTRLKAEHPNAAVVSYINTSAEVKAESDIIVTSSNAVKVVRSLKESEIIFVPDMNLGSYVAKQVPEKNIILWQGFCITHHRMAADDVDRARENVPGALVLVHPECKPEVAEKADFVGSTKGIIEYATQSPAKEFIIGTEMGVLYELKKRNPDKKFYMLSTGLLCRNMKKTTLKDVYDALNEMKYPITVGKDIRKRARKSLDRMLKFG